MEIYEKEFAVRAMKMHDFTRGKHLKYDLVFIAKMELSAAACKDHVQMHVLIRTLTRARMLDTRRAKKMRANSRS
jgi:hypothetical protein